MLFRSNDTATTEIYTLLYSFPTRRSSDLALAEAELLRSAGLNYRYLFESLGIWLPRVRVECNFFRPVKLDELLVVEAFFSRIGRTSVHLDFAVRRKAAPDVVASGRYVLVCVRQKDFGPIPVPAEIRERLAPFLEEGSDQTRE